MTRKRLIGRMTVHPNNNPDFFPSGSSLPISITTVGPPRCRTPSFDGALVASPNALCTNTSIPAVEAFTKAMELYSPDIMETPQFNTGLMFAWAGDKLFEKAVLDAKLMPTSTSEDLKGGHYALKNKTLDGLAPPLNFTKGKPAFPSLARGYSRSGR
jgi:hypothetical protein